MSYEKERAKLEKLFGEEDSSDSYSEIDSDSSEPFADDGEYSGRDPNYVPHLLSSET